MTTPVCPSLIGLHSLQREALGMDDSSLPFPDSWTPNDERRFEDRMLASLSAHGAPSLDRSQLATASLAKLANVYGLSTSILDARGIPHGSEMGRWVARLVNAVAETHPTLLSKHGQWSTSLKSNFAMRMSALELVLTLRLHPDVATLTDTACKLLSSTLNADLVRDQMFNLTQSGRTNHLVWATSLGLRTGDQRIIDRLRELDCLKRLIEMGAAQGQNSKNAMMLLGRLAQRRQEAGPDWKLWANSKKPPDWRASASASFRAFTGAVVKLAIDDLLRLVLLARPGAVVKNIGGVRIVDNVAGGASEQGDVDRKRRPKP